MDLKKKQLLYAIVKFLDQEKGTLTEDLGESVEGKSLFLSILVTRNTII